MLNDYEIRNRLRRGDLRLTPDEGIESRIQPASIDVRLGSQFAVYRRDRGMVIDPKIDTAHLLDFKDVGDDDVFVIHPGEFVLATTMETLELPANLVARVEGKSSLGRLGLLVHSTAGFIDPLFRGEITLELACVNSLPIRLYPGMPIGQLCFSPCMTVTTGGYRGKYQGQSGPTASRYHQNWREGELGVNIKCLYCGREQEHKVCDWCFRATSDRRTADPAFQRMAARTRELEMIVALLVIRHGSPTGEGVWSLSLSEQEAFDLRARLASRDAVVIPVVDPAGDYRITVL